MPTGKYKRVLALSTEVIRQEVLCGSLRWKVTELSRASRTARSRIYELLGKSKPEILRNSLKIVLEEIYGLSAERQEFDKGNNQFQGFVRSRDIVMQCPE